MSSQKARTSNGGSEDAAPDSSRKVAIDRRLTPRSESRRALSDLARQLSDERPGHAISAVVVSGIARMVEFVLFVLTGIGCLLALAPSGEGSFWLTAALVPAIAILAIFALEAAHAYSMQVIRRNTKQLLRALIAWSAAVLIPYAWLAFVEMVSVRTDWIIGWWLAGSVALIVFRLGLHVLVMRWTQTGRLTRRTVIVGGGAAGAKLIDALRADTASDTQLLGVFDDREDERSSEVVAGLPKLGTVADLIAFARRTRIDLIIFTIPITAEARILQMLKKLSVLPVDIRLSAHSNQLQFSPRSYSYIGSVPVIDIKDKPIADWDVVIKAVFDRVVGALTLVLVSPIMLITAIAIKLDSKGPVLFRQKRYGFNNELIEVFKFRSMYTDQTDHTASKLVTKGDPRVTRVGRFIRKTSIDELPQLFNVVFVGNLSLVGPRPHAVHAKAAERRYDEAVDGYFSRHRVKPGITGWAQINGWRGETDTAEKIQHRVEHDLYYIENWSVFLDLYILIKTPISLLTKSENAF